MSSTLKISGDEQLTFLKDLWQNKLTVSFDAINSTKLAIYTEKSENGSIIYDKTGGGFVNGYDNKKGRIGWFVGYLSCSTNNHDYVFITNFTDELDSDVLVAKKLVILQSKLFMDCICGRMKK